MNPRKVLSVLAIIFVVSVSMLSLVQPAHAVLPVAKTNNKNTANNCTACTVTITPAAAGDILVVIYQAVESASTGTVTSASDTAGDSFVNVVNNLGWAYSNTPYYGYLGMFYATTSSLSAQTVTVTFGQQMATATVQVFDFGPANGFVSVGSTCTGLDGTLALAQCTNSVSFSTDVLLVGAEYGASVCHCNPAAASWVNPNVDYEVMYSAQTVGTGVPSPTTFPWANSAVPANGFFVGVIGAVFNFASTSASAQTQTIGSCPKAGNGHVVPANSTQYWYSGNALGSEVVNTVQTEVSSVKGSSAQNIQLVLYVSTAQSPSVQNPATLAWYQIVSVSAGTTNSTITFQVNIPLNTIASGTLPFNFWAVGIVGNDHVYIVQSTLSGMTTQSGSAAGSVQPYSFTSAGSASGSKMGLCATGNYQSVLPAVTTTVTTGGTTSTTVSTTTTATISTIGPALFSTASNWPVIFLILLLPAGLFLGVTRSLAGALLGLAVGSVIGLMMGILPPFVFAGLLIALVAVAFVARERSP